MQRQEAQAKRCDRDKQEQQSKSRNPNSCKSSKQKQSPFQPHPPIMFPTASLSTASNQAPLLNTK
jgi:hypothetical protein